MPLNILCSLQKFWLYTALLLGLAVISSQALATSLSSSVDRQQIGEDETLNLTVTADDAGFSGDPDLAGLDSNFQILTSNSSSSKTYINGTFSSKKEWHYTLLPKHSGKLLIPSFKLDKLFSDAIEIDVSANAANAGNNNNAAGQTAHGDLFLEQQIDKTEAFVQEHITLTLRLYTAIQIAQPQIPDPVFPGIMVEKLGESEYQSKQNGRDYTVLEYRYGLFANNSGKVVLPKQRYEINQVINNRQASPFDLFGISQPATRTRFLSTREITLSIKSQPDHLPTDYWLASEDVQITDNWPEQQTVDVGTPLTRTIQIKALGNLAAHIPPLPALNISGLKSYSEPPALDTTHTNDNFLAVRKETTAIVPIQPGTYQLPAITLHWWDTKNSQFKVSTLPERTLIVRNAVGTTASSGTAATTPPSSPDTTSGNHSSTASSIITPPPLSATPAATTPWYRGIYPWISVALVFLLLWITTLALLLRKQSSAATSLTRDDSLPQNTLKIAEKELKLACLKNDARQARLLLICWAQTFWPDAQLNTLQKIKQHGNNDPFSKLIDELDSSLYRDNSVWNGKPLADFMQAAKFNIAKVGNEITLPALYN